MLELWANDVKVWWIPQVPMKAFEYYVPDVRTGLLLLDALALYDLFQYDNRIKPDYANVGGVAYKDENGEWTDVDENDPEDIANIEILLVARANGQDG